MPPLSPPRTLYSTGPPTKPGGPTVCQASAHAEEHIDQKLVQLLVEVPPIGQAVEVPCLALQRLGLVAVDAGECELGSRGGLEGLLDLGQRVEVLRQLG